MKLFELAGTSTIIISFLDPADSGSYYSHIIGDKATIKAMLEKNLSMFESDRAKKALEFLAKDDWNGFGNLGLLSMGEEDTVTSLSGTMFIDGDHGEVKPFKENLINLSYAQDDE